MPKKDAGETPYAGSGCLMRRLREAKGLSRRDIAEAIKVDVSSVVGWEQGKRLPREKLRLPLARILGSDVSTLFAGGQAPLLTAALFDTIEELPDLLLELTQATRRLRALRLAAPHVTPSFVLMEWRRLVAERLLDGSLEVQRIEIFYDLRRLQEVLANIIRYEGRPYYVKSFCPGLREVAPAMGGFFFDEDEFLLGAYWSGMPPIGRPGLRLHGHPFRVFFEGYWHEIWGRGTLLNLNGAYELSAVRTLALTLGLKPEEWEDFVAKAKILEVGDGAPPLV